jgi:hypothetical protein
MFHAATLVERPAATAVNPNFDNGRTAGQIQEKPTARIVNTSMKC